ncbi:UBX domain-containing protein 11 [Mugil cephalus]|uniref:UBX domain-containing protein 11 n=1 Tax=Mugil cephalus TaxID=48193 RepID=UPI001FB8500F|nr:UBX domain-containing protein 11 [Mugil cephalus]
MSSPLSMLKKRRRTPLQGPGDEQWAKQKVPFRRNLLKEFQTALAPDVSSEPNPPPPSAPSEASTSVSKAPAKKGAPPSDFELMSAMMQRVTLLENTVKSQSEEIKQKDKKISVLQKKLKVQEEPGHSRGSSGRDDFERTCQQLQKQVQEMEKFLSDYGLVWVGEDDTRDAAEDASADRSFRMNFDLVLQRIKELNVLAGDGESFVRATSTGAQLAHKDPIRLMLYRNGIVMFDGPFRSYQEQSTQECMQDLMDGYFPTELQERFPDGVPFEVHDRRDEEFAFRLPWDTFPGGGQAVCGETCESAVDSTLPGRKLTVDQFLNKLPKLVVKAGRVIDIRDSVRATLQGSSDAQSSSSVILIDTPALQAMTGRPLTSTADQPPVTRGVVTLRVKSEDGSQVYVVTMCFSETVGDLREYLDKHRGVGRPGYDIISAYPQRHYDDDGQTLQSCGLSTNATLLLRKRNGHSLTEVNKPIEGYA